MGRKKMDYFLQVSIHEIRSNNRVGPALWSFDFTDCPWDLSDLQLLKSTENPLAFTFWGRFSDHWKLFEISTTETDASDNFPIIESGKIDFDLKIKELKWVHKSGLGLSEIFIVEPAIMCSSSQAIPSQAHSSKQGSG